MSILSVCLGVAATISAYGILTILPDALALRRRHYWRWWWRLSEDEDTFWPLTRIPRGPRPAFPVIDRSLVGRPYRGS